MLIEAVTRAQGALQELLTAIPVLQRNISHSVAQHEAIVAAVLAGDDDGARACIEEHCDAPSALLRAYSASGNGRVHRPSQKSRRVSNLRRDVSATVG